MYRLTGLPGWMRFPAHVPVAPAPYGTPRDEEAFLRDQAEFLREQLKAIETRLSEVAGDAGRQENVQK